MMRENNHEIAAALLAWRLIAFFAYKFEQEIRALGLQDAAGRNEHSVC